MAHTAPALAAGLDLVSIGPRGGNGAVDVALGPHILAPRDRVLFVTREAVTLGDSDRSSDVFRRRGRFTTRVTSGLINGNGFADVFLDDTSASGTKVFFSTHERLTADDTDRARDIYERDGDGTRLISKGPGRTNGPDDATFRRASADGRRVVFTTRARLTPDDRDDTVDVYERHGAGTTLVSRGSTRGLQRADARFEDASADGRVVLFSTFEALTAADTDQARDVYARRGTETTLVSTGQINGNQPVDVRYAGASSDAHRVFFTTGESLVADDSDTAVDVYERSPSGIFLVSSGPPRGQAASDAAFAGASIDGRHVFLETADPLTPADHDRALDVYERFHGHTRLLSRGKDNGSQGMASRFAGASLDGSHVFFTTRAQLVRSDQDRSVDVYEDSGKAVRLVSTGTQRGQASSRFLGASADGAHVFFETRDRLTRDDLDSSIDIYERSSGSATVRVSRGGVAGNGHYDATLRDISPDGARALFETRERLTRGDHDSRLDLYVARLGSASVARSAGAGRRWPLLSVTGRRALQRFPLWRAAYLQQRL